MGSGGREHALCWAIAASPLCDKLYCAPGNAGIAREAELVAIAADDVAGLVSFARDNGIDFVVVGPETALVAGLVDRLEQAGVKAFGPSAAAAALEGSKGLMKDMCARHSIPTAAYQRFDDAESAKNHIRAHGAPMVVKADGLAAGKGVVVAATVDEALAAVDALQRHGSALVIEECLEGPELSYLALCDGETALPLAAARDHKRALDGDKGPNTGGMGAYSPVAALTDALEGEILEQIIRPTVAAMASEGRPFKGVLFAGLILTRHGPKLLEFNVRFGDPECQVLMMRLMSDILPALVAARDGELKKFHLRWYPQAAVTVVMANRGYPGAYDGGSPIQGLEALDGRDDLMVFHAGTGSAGGNFVAQGGRVLNVTALGDNLGEARNTAYAAIDEIDWPQGFYRQDIAAGEV